MLLKVTPVYTQLVYPSIKLYQKYDYAVLGICAKASQIGKGSS